MTRAVERESAVATCDPMIRGELLARLRRDESRCSRTVIVNELGVLQGRARVDVAVINGSIHGYEIKSDRDTLARLPGQVEAFSQVLDFITVVASTRHVPGVREMVPPWWGLDAAEVVGQGLKIVQVRSAKRNAGIDPAALVQLLWRDEALVLLGKLGIAKGLRSKPRKALWDRLTEVLSPRQLSETVRQTLIERTEWRESCELR